LAGKRIKTRHGDLETNKKIEKEKNDNANNFEKSLQIQEETITRQRAYAGNTLADEIRRAADAMR